ncbi:class I SAM-dependent methyltransferase [Actinoplanes teichomyceticus]|uniref:Methyltransferase family protein n=1 Tax=Actinoplanes teichomyceticus TaxID=1867 RepID=A0A561VSV3_ACTTI|nr:class I SAM-dependent methyltransferase [Actinoplanes teichomyceticus]TWG14678.1 methyltransferase family protein [Actinoplanes teichomyceticus]GIF10081.1 hypothetical protein Ate01nite_01130 [Actinoplanes teichomyceticus]
MPADPIVETYSRRASEYSGAENQGSCWGLATRELWASLDPRPGDRTIADVGCGDGAALREIHERAPGARLLGVEPAEGLRAIAADRVRGAGSAEIVDGRFEDLRLPSGTVDYLYSLMAFHWVTDPAAGAAEIGRVLAPAGRADLFFIGRYSGREFIKATTPIFLRHFGPARVFGAAQLRCQLTRDDAEGVFSSAMPDRRVTVREWYDTRYDTVAGHLAWWVRIEGQLLEIGGPAREQCESEIRAALGALETPAGVPYTLHLLHVRIEPGTEAP